MKFTGKIKIRNFFFIKLNYIVKLKVLKQRQDAKEEKLNENVLMYLLCNDKEIISIFVFFFFKFS